MISIKIEEAGIYIFAGNMQVREGDCTPGGWFLLLVDLEWQINHTNAMYLRQYPLASKVGFGF
jgi:hypothetical protein